MGANYYSTGALCHLLGVISPCFFMLATPLIGYLLIKESFMRGLFLLFIIVPVIEMFILIQVGGIIGPWPTIGLVLLTAFIGVNLLRQQGFATLSRANLRMEKGELPGQEMLEGIFLAVGGAMLLTPGFMTDTFGFLCLLPFFRQGIIKRLMASGAIVTSAMGGSAFTQGARSSETFRETTSTFRDEEGQTHTVIDGEYTREDDNK